MVVSASQRRTYLDFNATAPLRPAVRDAVEAALALPGNASSIHAEGRAARAAIETARAEVAALVAAPAAAVTFTSGATEAVALALAPGLARCSGGDKAVRLIVGATEHPAVAAGGRFEAGEVTVAPVDRDGIVDLSALQILLGQPGRAAVAVQLANGETGVIQPVAAVTAAVHAAGGILVCDASQAAGRIDLAAAAGADVILLSAHKLGGPQGVGAVVARGDDLRLVPLNRGGGQERGIRGGTENVPAIVGFGAAARLASVLDPGPGGLRDALEVGLREAVPDLVVFGAAVPRLPNTSAFGVAGIDNQTALIALDLAGFAVSTGSACSSGKVSRSLVLEAMGVEDHLRGSMLRVSVGWSTTAEDIRAFVDAFGSFVRQVRGRSARRAA